MMKHRHIPFGNGHITWTGDVDPTDEQLEAFEKMRELALNMHEVNCQREQLVCKCGCDSYTKAPFTGKLICQRCSEPWTAN